MALTKPVSVILRTLVETTDDNYAAHGKDNFKQASE
jgi:hypothetical protein